jgi:hypothetical protein
MDECTETTTGDEDACFASCDLKGDEKEFEACWAHCSDLRFRNADACFSVVGDCERECGDYCGISLCVDDLMDF